MDYSKKLTNVGSIGVNKFVNAKAKEQKPTISISYLDKNKYNIKYLFKCSKGNNKCVEKFQDFLYKASSYNSISDLVANHKPHDNLNNKDKLSNDKVTELRKKFNIDVDQLIHLHCCTNGNGPFVIHGFRITNHFEIVWLDPKHEIHNK